MHALAPYILTIFALFYLEHGAFAAGQDIRPDDVIHWEPVRGEVTAAGNRIDIGLRLRTEQDFTIYQTNLTITGPAGFPVAEIKAPPTVRQLDPISGEEVEVYQGGDFEISFVGLEPWQGEVFPVAIKYVGCTQVICLFPHTVELAVKVFRGQPNQLSPTAPPLIGDTLVPAAEHPADKAGCDQAQTVTDDSESLESQLAQRLSAGGFSFGMLLLIVFIGGLLSNLTPCVYPMIPITLRLLGRPGHSPYFGASFYALGIVITYSALGLVAALSGGLFGSIMASPTFNVAFASVMIVLGVSMLGFGNFSALQNIGNRLGTGQPTAKNYFLMGAGAGLVAAPCTGPILAALLAYTAKNQDTTQSIALMLSYSLGFALPYLVLGGAAAKASKIKIPPQAQVAVKLVFASIMFALGFNYLRVPLYAWTLSLKPFWGQIAGLSLVIGVLLVIACVVVTNLAQNKALQLLPALVLGLGIFSMSQKFSSLDGESACTPISWFKDEAQALAAAKSAGKPLLIDMWAEWCEACKKMDATTFQDPRVQAQLAGGWLLLKLDLTESTAVNDAIQEKYELSGLPTLVLMPADGNMSARQALTGYQSAVALLAELSAFVKKGH